MGICNPTPRPLPPTNYQPQYPSNYPPNHYFISPHRRGEAINPGMWIEIAEPMVTIGLGWDFTEN